MRIKFLLAGLAALSVATAPVAAASKPAAAPAAATEVSPQSETAEGSEIRRGYLLPLAIIIAIIIGVILLTGMDDEKPASP